MNEIEWNRVILFITKDNNKKNNIKKNSIYLKIPKVHIHIDLK